MSSVRITSLFRQLLAYALMLLLPGACVLIAQDQSDSATPITISGQVVNALTGVGLPRVLVKLNQRAVLTDHEGKFQFEQFTGTANSLEATKPGFYLSTDPIEEGASISLQAGRLSAPIIVRLYPGRWW